MVKVSAESTGKSEWDAARLLRVSGAYWESFALHAGVRLDLFTDLGEECLTAGEIGKRTGWPLRGLGMLLDALAAMGLLLKDGEAYANTEAGRALLCKASPGYIGYIIRHHQNIARGWSDLTRAVQTGGPVRKGARDEDEIESFIMGMHNQAMGLSPRAAREIDLTGRRRLLDLGGGPGTYAVHFCLANSGLRATVFDLPTTRPFAEKNIAAFDLADRIEFRAGNYLEDEIPGSYDAAWLSHILHALGPEACETVLGKAVSVLEPGGCLLVHEFILEDSGTAPRFAALFALNMLVNTAGGRSYTEGRLREMLTRAGLRDVRRLPFRGPNDSGVMLGRA